MATLKYSRQRESIKEFLTGRTDHPTADFVYENMKQIYPNISLGTVYRNLSLLADLGEIQKLSSFGGADRFDARTVPHCHFMCTRCGRVMDVFSEHIDKSLESIAADFKDGQISDYKARFFGICKECLKEELFCRELQPLDKQWPQHQTLSEHSILLEKSFNNS